MMRYVGTVVGFCLISAAWITATMLVLFMLVMSHCSLSDAERASGATCTPPADLYFWPTAIMAVIGLVCVQWVFLRRALRKRH